MIVRKQSRDLHDINLRFRSLIHAENTNEQDILKFINHEPQAYHIVGSIFNAGGFRFGHHSAYLFPEFRLGTDYRTDYLLVGKSSGGYEFIFVELERSNGRISLKDGSFGQAIRSGNSQIKSWKKWIDANFHTLKPFFDSEKRTDSILPEEFYKFDNTRMHYVVVAGTREDYNDNTYYLRRSESLDSNMQTLHYDNLFDAAEELLSRNSF